MDKKNFGLGVLVAVIGLLVMINPESSIKVIVILLGIEAVVDGLYTLLKMRKLIDDPLYNTTALIKGLLSIVVGLLAIVLPVAFFNAVTNVIRVMLYVVAVYLLLGAASEIFSLIRLSQFNVHTLKKSLIVSAVGSVVIAVLLFMLPKDYGQTVVRIIGILLMAGGAGYSVWTIVHKPIIVEPENVRDEESNCTEKSEEDNDEESASDSGSTEGVEDKE